MEAYRPPYINRIVGDVVVCQRRTLRVACSALCGKENTAQFHFMHDLPLIACICVKQPVAEIFFVSTE